VKSFSLAGARIANDWNGPQQVHHKNMLNPIWYFVVLPGSGRESGGSQNPIKISSPSLQELERVYNGVKMAVNSGLRSNTSMSQDEDAARGGGGSDNYYERE